MVRRARTDDFESRRTWSRCLLSSRCSGVKVKRGGLEVKDLEVLGGVILGSGPWPMEPKSWPNRSWPDSRPGQVKEDRGMPISILGSYATATVLLYYEF